MERELLFSTISTGIFVAGFLPYFIDVIKRRTIPHAFSYGMWAILVGINAYVLFLEKEWYSFMPGFINSVSCGILFLFGIKHFKKVEINWFDWLCLTLILILIGFYFITRNLFLTIWFTLIVDGIAFLPTFKKGWLQPWTETVSFYIAACATQIFTLLAFTGSQALEATFFWWYLLVANFLFSIMVIIRRWYLEGWSSIFR